MIDKDKFAEALGISKNDQQILDDNSNHPYNCMCETCKSWWVLMGPDGGERGNYGPFTEDQIRQKAIEMNKLKEFEAMSENLEES